MLLEVPLYAGADGRGAQDLDQSHGGQSSDLLRRTDPGRKDQTNMDRVAVSHAVVGRWGAHVWHVGCASQIQRSSTRESDVSMFRWFVERCFFCEALQSSLAEFVHCRSTPETSDHRMSSAVQAPSSTWCFKYMGSTCSNIRTVQIKL